MAIVVENSTDQVEAALNHGVFPVPPEVKADNEAREAKKTDKPVEAKADAKPEKGAEAAKPDAESDDIEGEDGLTPRQKRGFTKSMLATIAKKHRKQMEAEEFAATQFNEREMANQRAANLQSELEKLRLTKSEPSPPKEVGPKEPKRTDFTDDQAFWDAMVDYRVDKRDHERQQEAAKKTADEQKRLDEQASAELLAHARAKVERAIELVDDYKEVTGNSEQIVPPFVAGYMQGSEMFAELGYHFAKNPDVLKSLQKITDGLQPGTKRFENAVTRQLVEVGKIESTLQPFGSTKEPKAQEDNTPKASQTNGTTPSETGSAPSSPRIAPIIRPLNGSGANVEKNPAERSQAEELSAWQRKHGITLTARKRH